MEVRSANKPAKNQYRAEDIREKSTETKRFSKSESSIMYEMIKSPEGAIMFKQE